MAKKKNLLQSMEEDRRNRRTFRQAMAKELREHKSSFLVFSVLRILVIVSLVRQIMRGSYESAFFCLLALCLLYLPSWLQVKLRIELPPPGDHHSLLHLRRGNPGGGQRLLRGGPQLGHHAPHPQRLSGRGGGLLHGHPAQRQ